MNNATRALFLTLVAGLAVAGCQTEQPEAESTVPQVAFEGSPDSRFVGTWKTENGNSTYSLQPDGSFRLKSTVSTPGGKFDTESNGLWRVKNDHMLFKDADGLVSTYRHELAGDKLTLTRTGSMKTKTVLLRQKRK